jgi:adenylosuccinate lyase
MPDFNTYLSPFTWRYGSEPMRRIWSEHNKRLLWRTIWLRLAEAQSDFDLVTAGQLQELDANHAHVDVSRSLEIEKEIHHDLMAELKAFAEQCPSAAGILHLGATSMDIEDNADALRLRQAMDLLLERLRAVLIELADKVELWAEIPIMAFTHLQPAEPTALGYRFAMYAQDLLADWEDLTRVRADIRGKGFKGAVGTAASYIELLGAAQYDAFEKRMSELLGISFYQVAAQTYPRKQDFVILSCLSSLAASLHKLAFDLRLLQSPVIGEIQEPFGKHQVGSSAMPFKRNPIQGEKIDSLARSLASMPQIAWHNAANSLLERTLDDSANRRTLLPEAFLTADEILMTIEKVLRGLQVNRQAISINLDTYAPFAGTERLMMALVKSGADRQEMHERLRQLALQAWAVLQQEGSNPLVELAAEDEVILAYLPAESVRELMQVESYTGIAPSRALQLAAAIRERLNG